jgi:predicted nucleic acid-binding protein
LENHLIAVDTDVIIDFFRDISPAAEVLSELISREQAALTAVSVFELYAGVEGAKRLREIETLPISLRSKISGFYQPTKF